VFVSANSGASAYPEETVMAYRQPLSGSWPTWYADADIEAMVQLWGAEQQVFTDGADIIQGNNYSESFLTGLGDDVITGLQGNDIIRAGQGNDQIFAGKGDDQIFGGFGNDQITAGQGRDTINAGPGDDQIWAGPGADRIVVSPGSDVIMDFNGFEGDRLTISAGDVVSVEQQVDRLLIMASTGTTALMGQSLAAFDLNRWILVS
jgi:Ca2+-binding RTX toxin-like protein